MNRRLFALSCLATALATAPGPAAAASVRARLQSFKRRAWRSRMAIFGLIALGVGIPLYLRSLAGRDETPPPWEKRE